MTQKIKYISPEAKNYGHALLDLGFTLDSVQAIQQTLVQTPELTDILLNPAVELTEKRNLVDRIFKDDHSANLVKLLIDRGKLPMIYEILAATEEMLLAVQNTTTAKLSYVAMPTQDQLKQMEQVLKSKLGCKKIHWEFTEDSSLLGGFRLDAGDLYFDYSVKGRLDEMKNRLTGNSGR